MSSATSKKVQATKLSRAKKATSSKVVKTEKCDFNESAEDFVDDATVHRPRAKILDKENSNVTEISSVVVQNSLSALPKCPFCGKSFVIGQELRRASHLKSCGSSLGISTEKLLEIRRLEEKQASEWKQLALPSVANNSNAEKSKTVNKSKAKGSTNPDPNLELAIALSASLAQAQNDSQKEFLIEMGGSGSNPVQNEVPEILLADATVWPIGYGKGPTQKKSDIKTTLQTRTDAERLRQISEVAERIISAGFETFPVTSHQCRAESSPFSQILKGWRDKSKRLWKSAEMKELQQSFVKALELYTNQSTDRAQTVEVKSRENNLKTVPKQNGPLFLNTPLSDKSDSSLSGDWDKLFASGDASDLTIFSKEEIPFPCHTLVILVRCKNILDEIILENNSSSESKKVIAWDEVSADAIKIFLRFLYAGKLPANLSTKTELFGLRLLSNKYDVKILKDFVKLFNEDDLQGEESETTTLGGFVETAQLTETKISSPEVMQSIEETGPSATQNLEYLLGELEVGDGEEESDHEWDQVCEYLTQQSKLERSNSELELDVSKTSVTNLSQAELGEVFAIGANEENPLGGGDQERHDVDSSPLRDLPASDASPLPLRSIRLEANSDEIEFNVWEEMNNVISQKSENYNFSQPLKSLSNEARRSASPDLFADESASEVNLGSSPGYSESRKRKSECSPYSHKRSRLSSSPEQELPTPDKYSLPRHAPISFDLSPPYSGVVATQNVEIQSPLKTNLTPVIRRSLSTPSAFVKNGTASKSVTPKPDYELMLSPALRNELRKFGLKVIPRRKAIPLLTHIYQEMHPNLPEEQQQSGSQESDTNDDEDDDAKEIPEETLANDQLICEGWTGETESLADALISFIAKDAQLHRACLTYEPIWLEDVYAKFKTESGLKCSLSQVSDILDNECITFRTRARQNKTRRSPKKKKSNSP